MSEARNIQFANFVIGSFLHRKLCNQVARLADMACQIRQRLKHSSACRDRAESLVSAMRTGGKMQRLFARTAEMLEQESDFARPYGVFGSPSSVVDGEMFWCDDRLEEAIG
jgi:hypothetical protein